MHFVKSHRQYFLGRNFLLRTDHAALQWLRRTPEPIGLQGRWLKILEEFQFTVKCRPGTRRGNADAMSRRPCHQCGQCGFGEFSLDGTLNVCAIESLRHVQSDCSPTTNAREQNEDPDIGVIYKALTDGEEKPAWETVASESQDTKICWSQWGSLALLDAVMYR